MKLLRTKSRGFIGLKRDMGLDEIDIDWTNIFGLTALEGKSGMGKTTFLELCTPYRQFASRAGKLNSHVFLRDSYFENTYLIKGVKYRCLVKVDSDSDRSEGFVYVDDNEKSEVNGKLGEYDKFINNLFGSPELFFSSIFSAQKSKQKESRQLSDMTKGEMKELFVEFLGLHKYAAWEKTAKECGKLFAGKIETVEEKLKALEEKKIGHEDVLKSISDTNKSIWLVQEDIEDCNKSIIDCEIEIKKIIETENNNKILAEKVLGLEKEICGLHTEKKNIFEEYETKLAVFKNEIQSGREYVKDAKEIISQKDLINAAEKVSQSSKEKISMLTIEKESLERTIEELQSSRDDWSKKLEDLHADYKKETDIIRKSLCDNKEQADILNLTIKNINDQFSVDSQNVADEILIIKTKIDSLEKDLARIPEIDLLSNRKIKLGNLKVLVGDREIDPLCIDRNCEYIAKSINAQKEIPSVEKEIIVLEKTIEEEKEKINKQIVALNKEVDALSAKNIELIKKCSEYKKPIIAELVILSEKEIDNKLAYTKIDTELAIAKQEINDLCYDIVKQQDNARQDIATVKRDILVFESKLKECEVLLKDKSKIAVAEEQIRVWELKEEDLMEKGLSIKAEQDKKINDILSKIIKLETGVKEISDKIDTAISSDKIIADNKLSSVKKDKEAFVENKNNLERSLAVLNSKKEQSQDVVSDIENLTEKKQALCYELAEWNRLQYFCGKNGLQVLEIDAAIPSITAKANEILHEAYGGEYTIRIETQDNEGKEVFEIWVIRSKGEDTLLENLSGGQKVWNLKALRLAMALISIEKSGMDIGTAFADEEDGSLDEEKAERFINLYRAFMKAGNLRHCLMISHRSDVINMADNKLSFTAENGIQIVS